MINEFVNCSLCGEEICIKPDDIPPKFILVCKKEECCKEAIRLLSNEISKANLKAVMLGVRLREIELFLPKEPHQIPKVLTSKTESE